MSSTQTVNMYKPVRPRRNSLPSSKIDRSKTKDTFKTYYSVPDSNTMPRDSFRPKSKTSSFVKQNESYIRNNRTFMNQSMSDGDDISDSKTSFFKVAKQTHVIKDKRPQVSRSQPIDMPNKRLQETPLHHSPPINSGPNKKFKEDDIKQLVIEKYAILKQLMNIDESNGDNFYAGAKFNNSPSPRDLPLPPMQWLNSCQAEAKKMQKSTLLFNVTM